MANTLDSDTADAGAKAKAPRGSKKKMLVIAAAVLLLGGGAGGYLMMGSGAKEPAAEAAGKPGAKKQIAFVELKEMTVNLAQTAGADRQAFMKLKIALEVADPKQVPEIQPLVPRVEDTFQVYMRELRPGELEGSAAVYRLKEELLKRVNVAVYPAKVDAVLFKEILIQ